MIAKFFIKLKFQQKLRASFLVMILLVVINALIAKFMIGVISNHIDYYRSIEQIIRTINQTTLSVHHFSRTLLREHANQVYFLLQSIQSQIKNTVETTDAEINQSGIQQQLEQFKLSFQTFVIKKEQENALENRAVNLGKSLVTSIDAIRTKNSYLFNSAELNIIVSQILEMQWQGQDVMLTKTPEATDKLRAVAANLITNSEKIRIVPRQTDEQQLIFRVIRDVKDYVAVFEHLIRHQTQVAHTEKTLLAIADDVYQSCVGFESVIYQGIRQQVLFNEVIMLLILILSFVFAQKVKSFLFFQITQPISELVQITRQIAEGSRTVRAEVTTDDEIGELARAFNIMTLSLLRFEEAMKLANQSLELRVKERTEELTELNKKLASLTMTDGLTGIANRRHFDEVFQKEYARHLRSGACLSIILLDIDHFKQFNDHYGHPEGDACLCQIAKRIAECVTRVTDLAARYGGEEFVCILPETELEGAIVIAEQIRLHIVAAAIPHEFSSVAKIVTVSLGLISTRCTDDKSKDQLLKKTDQMLYQAKANGRNCLEFYCDF